MKKLLALETQREQRLARAVIKRSGIYKKFTNVIAGDPDRLILLSGGRSWFVELKRDGEQPTKLQRSRLKRLQLLGFNTKVINSEKTYLELIEEMDLL